MGAAAASKRWSVSCLVHASSPCRHAHTARLPRRRCFDTFEDAHMHARSTLPDEQMISRASFHNQPRPTPAFPCPHSVDNIMSLSFNVRKASASDSLVLVSCKLVSKLQSKRPPSKSASPVLHAHALTHSYQPHRCPKINKRGGPSSMLRRLTGTAFALATASTALFSKRSMASAAGTVSRVQTRAERREKFTAKLRCPGTCPVIAIAAVLFCCCCYCCRCCCCCTRSCAHVLWFGSFS